MMRDLSHIGEYAKLDNNAFRLLKNGFFPVVVRNDKKRMYLDALSKADNSL
jgi:hydrogenase maturation factor HypF (carbamoyltransferase family)